MRFLEIKISHFNIQFPISHFTLRYKFMYDLVIIGIGPAGLTASIYASRYKLNHVLVGQTLGGMIALAHKVENYPGFTSVTGVELSQKMEEQVKSLGGEIVKTTVGRIERIGEGFKVYGANGQIWETKTVVLANGSQRRQLNVPGEKEYLGKGVSYCTTCDAPFFRGKTVAVVGGSDSAVSGAIHAAAFADKVYLIHRRNEFRAEPVWVLEMEKNPKIIKIMENEVTEIRGDLGKVTGVVLAKPFNGQEFLAVDGIFIEIGGVPGTSLAIPLGVEIDKTGYLKVQDDMSTNVPGFFAAGDLTDKAQVLVQMTTACAQGAIASASVFKYLKGEKAPKILG